MWYMHRVYMQLLVSMNIWVWNTCTIWTHCSRPYGASKLGNQVVEANRVERVVVQQRSKYTIYLFVWILAILRNEPNIFRSRAGEGTKALKCEGVQSGDRIPHRDGKSVTPSLNDVAGRAVWLWGAYSDNAEKALSTLDNGSMFLHTMGSL
jgi:hypothetical protein